MCCIDYRNQKRISNPTKIFYEALQAGVPVPHIPLIILKTSYIPKINMANITKIQKALYSYIPKIGPSYPYPFKYLQKYPVSL